MKFTKLGILRTLLVMALALVGYRAYAGTEYRRVPIDTEGRPVHNANVSGAKVFTSSATTNSVQVATGKGLVYAVLTSSSAGATGVDTYVILRDSGTINTAQSTWLVPPIVFGGLNGTNLQYTVPLRFTNGLQVQVGLATSTVSVSYTLDAD